MSRTTARTAVPLLIVALAASHAPVAAQQAPRGAAWSAFRVEQPAASPLPAPRLPLAAAPAAQTKHASLGRRVLHVLGGAVVGSGVGYFASQVKYSDWDKQNNSEFSSQRALYTGGGAGLGALVGLLIGARPGEDMGIPAPPALPGGGDVATRSAAPGATGKNAPIGHQEIVRAGATNALQVIQSLRPLWLQDRGVQRMREGATGQSISDQEAFVQEGATMLKVYMDGALLGGIESLRQVQAATIQSIEYLDPAAATLRFGQGVTHGVIVVHTSGG
ncbi:MAG: hypothetical protein JO040_13950 [Gemmatimonadetes bacterium]|nr:hypothetical protein [Gemmatimonadota bacterium]